MAIKQVGHGVWESSLLGETFTSREAAEHYENLEKQRNKKKSTGDKLMDSLSTEDLKSFLIAANARIDENANRPRSDAQAGEWLTNHPELFGSNAEAATVNGAALRTYLLQQGKHEPFSHWDL